jgi:LytS/YehU family sensor histidine kinase
VILILLFYRFKKKQFDTKQKLLILEQKALFAQMNPHFIFNTLNSIQSFLIYNENEKAEYFLSKFSKLLRETLHISRNSSVLLEKEIDILKKYLELEQMRFSNKFQWELKFNSPENQFNMRIPNMLIQPYVENSIKHGFNQKRNDFTIEIVFTLVDEHTLKCEVIDNGIGREASQLNKKVDLKLKDHISYGEKITKERLKSYNKKGQNRYKSTHFDLKEKEEVKGTKVEIIIPIIKR